MDNIYKLSIKTNKEETEENEFYHELDSLFKNIQVMERDVFDKEMCDALGKCLACVFHSSYSIVILPTEKTTDEQYSEILSRPLYQLFRFLCEGDQQSSKSITNLISLTYSIQVNQTHVY